MLIKFCGIRRFEDVELMNIFRPDFVGFVFAESKRQVSPRKASELSAQLDKGIKKVGVFVNENIDTVSEAVEAASLDVIQLHGEENEEYIKSLRVFFPQKSIWKAVRVKSSEDIKKAEGLSVDMLLLDSFSESEYGGSGRVADLSVIKCCEISKPYFLAGGINASNAISIFNEIKPNGLDISSGIEENGVKDFNKIQEIMRCIEWIRRGDTASSADNTFPKP